MSATGRKRRDADPTVRAERDAYQTPHYCVAKLLEHLVRPREPFTFAEPCRGAGTIYNAVREWAPHAELTHAEITEGIDYLDLELNLPADLLITNPPFRLAREFVEKSLAQANSVIYLLPLNFFGSNGRRAWWQSAAMQPSHIMPITPRPRFRNGASDACEYAWICWDRAGFVRGPVSRWLRVL